MTKRWPILILAASAVLLAACEPESYPTTERDIAARNSVPLAPKQMAALRADAASWDGVCTSLEVITERLLEHNLARYDDERMGRPVAERLPPYISQDVSAAAQLGCLAAVRCYDQRYIPRKLAEYDVLAYYIMAAERGADVEADIARVRDRVTEEFSEIEGFAYRRYFDIQKTLERDPLGPGEVLVPHCPD